MGVVTGGEVRHPGRAGVGVRPAQLLLGDVLVQDRLDDVRARDEHVGGLLRHHDEVRDGRGVDGPARAGPHDEGDLRYDARGEGVPQEDVRVARQGADALLDPRTARVVEPYHGGTHLHGQVHDLADLPRVGFGEGAAEDREVVGEEEYGPAVHAAEPRHDAVARDALSVHPEIAAVVLHQGVGLFEGTGVEEEVHPLARRQLAGLVLGLHALRTAALPAGPEEIFEFSHAPHQGLSVKGR